MQRAQVQSLVRELRFCKPCGAAKKKKKKIEDLFFHPSLLCIKQAHKQKLEGSFRKAEEGGKQKRIGLGSSEGWYLEDLLVFLRDTYQ